ncbi:hypothetical protein AB0N05_31995 [Nocardia sp. NPDC051030]
MSIVSFAAMFLVLWLSNSVALSLITVFGVMFGLLALDRLRQ